MGRAEGIFAKSRNMGVVRQTDSQAYPFAQHDSQRYGAFPRQVNSILNITRLCVCTGCTDTDGTDTLVASIGFNHGNDTLTESADKPIYIVKTRCIKIILGKNIATDIHYGISRSVVTDVNTNNLGLYNIIIHIPN